VAFSFVRHDVSSAHAEPAAAGVPKRARLPYHGGMHHTIRLPLFALLAALSVSACGLLDDIMPHPTMREAHRHHTTQLATKISDSAHRMSPAPDGVGFKVTTYSTALGPMQVMHSVHPARPAKRAAMVWVTGGFPAGGMDAMAWTPQPRTNDQSAAAYHAAGVVMVYPTFRGSSGNPGHQESFFGEVDDLMAAVAFAKTLPDVDDKRVFVGGHSTGGTLALLAAEMAKTGDVRGVISFGPVDDVWSYGAELVLCKDTMAERFARMPGLYLDDIEVPTLVVEGSSGNIASLRDMRSGASGSESDNVTYAEIRGASHFDVLAPLNEVLAKAIVADDGQGTFRFDAHLLQQAFDAEQKRRR